MRLLRLTIAGVLAVLLCGCGSSVSDDRSDTAEMVDSGSWYVRQRWPHDGNPVDSEHFVVYSDAAGIEARQEVADVAEDVWPELLDELAIDPRILRFPQGQDKVHIYAHRTYNPQDWEAASYYAGVIIWSPDNENRLTSSARLAAVMKHELVHVIQSLITGPSPNPIDVWFFEGLPEALSGGTAGGAIRGRDQLNDLTAQYGMVSPISFKTYSQIVSPESGERFNYPMFQLAVEYLLDPDGRGKSPADAGAVLTDVAAGVPFETAFEQRMGIGLDVYEQEFFDLTRNYLPRYRNPLFSPLGFAALSAAVITFVVGAPAVVYRRRRSVGRTGPREMVVPGRAARIGFHTGLVLSDIVIIAFFLGALFALGTMNELNNVVYHPFRTRASWSLAVYLFVSVGVVIWAVRRWIDGSRLAFLAAPLVIAATAVTGLVIILALTIG